jgi:alkanesulfonate monooxygenase SsuD/methylene tetrahydromethanopterin reductase-like flavin-dependent oxidoreductase (luciferase family)
VAVICAESDEAAERLATSSELAMVWFRQGIRDRSLPSVEEALAYEYDDVEQALRAGPASPLIVRGQAHVRDRLAQLIDATHADEVMVLTHVHDHEARRRSYTLVAEPLGWREPGQSSGGHASSSSRSSTSGPASWAVPANG